MAQKGRVTLAFHVEQAMLAERVAAILAGKPPVPRPPNEVCVNVTARRLTDMLDDLNRGD